MALAGKKLGLMISTGPEHPNLATVLGLSGAALDGGGQVYLYLIDDAGAAVEDPRVQALADQQNRGRVHVARDEAAALVVVVGQPPVLDRQSVEHRLGRGALRQLLAVEEHVGERQDQHRARRRECER